MPGMFAGGANNAAHDISDFFAAVARTGNGSSSWSVSGPNLTGGGFSWSKSRSSTGAHYVDYTPGDAAGRIVGWGASLPTTSPATFGSGGASFSTADANVNSVTYISYLMRKASRHFDVVYFTGNATNRTIPHSLGVPPAMIILKRLDSSAAPPVYHHLLAANMYFSSMGSDGAPSSSTSVWNNTSATSSVFNLGTSSATNNSGSPYVALLFAHDTASDGNVRAFSYVGNGISSGPTVALGWQPQFVMMRRNNGSGGFIFFDQSRNPGFTGNDGLLTCVSTASEDASADQLALDVNGFQVIGTTTPINASGSTYYGVAIRAP